MNTNKKRVFVIVLMAVLLFACFAPTVAFADFGPKNFVKITFQNVGDEVFYCTLISPKSAGPYYPWDGGEIYSHLPNDVFMAFANYNDADGYYFLQYGQQCNQIKTFIWDYHPPQTFKILLYYPQTETFVTSEVYQIYAFASYYKVDLAAVENGMLAATKNYNYFGEIAALILRIAITVALELGIAWLFRLRDKKTILCLLITNCVTQVVLNVILNVFNYLYGWLSMVLVYFMAEFFVFAIEAVTYSIALKKMPSPVPVWKSILYAFVANLFSFALGVVLAVVSAIYV